jgi:hypothetical protein
MADMEVRSLVGVLMALGVVWVASGMTQDLRLQMLAGAARLLDCLHGEV